MRKPRSEKYRDTKSLWTVNTVSNTVGVRPGGISFAAGAGLAASMASSVDCPMEICVLPIAALTAAAAAFRRRSSFAAAAK